MIHLSKIKLSCAVNYVDIRPCLEFSSMIVERYNTKVSLYRQRNRKARALFIQQVMANCRNLVFFHFHKLLLIHACVKINFLTCTIFLLYFLIYNLKKIQHTMHMDEWKFFKGPGIGVIPLVQNLRIYSM